MGAEGAPATPLPADGMAVPSTPPGSVPPASAAAASSEQPDTHVVPAGGAREGSTGQAQPQQICVMCQQDLKSNNEEVLALTCAHVFHRTCTEEYMESTGK